MACIQALSYENFWELFSAAGEPEVRRQILNEHYVKDIRPSLSDEARAFWDDNQHELVNGILYAGMSGLAARGLMYLAWFFGLGSLIDGTYKLPPSFPSYQADCWSFLGVFDFLSGFQSV